MGRDTKKNEKCIVSTSKLLTWGEATQIYTNAGVSVSTFRRRVREGIIQTVPGKKARDTRYPRDQVLAALAQEKRRRKSLKDLPDQQGSEGEVDWINDRDLPYILAYDYEMYGVDATVDIPKMHSWWQKNPRMGRMIFDKKDRRNIWGSISILPMKEETILKVLRNEMSEHQITTDDILTYEPGGKYYGYISAASIKPEHRTYLRALIEDLLHYWCDQYPEIQLVKLYAIAWSEGGWDLVKHLFFSPRRDLSPDAFELDLMERNPSRFLKQYQQCIRLKDRQI